MPSAVSVVDQISVGPDLRVVGDLDGILHKRPLPAEAAQSLAPFGSGAAPELSVQNLGRLHGVGGQVVVRAESRVGDEVLPPIAAQASGQ